MKKLALSLSLITFLTNSQIVSADSKAILKLRADESFGYFFIPAKEAIKFSSEAEVTASTNSIFIKSDKAFSSIPATEDANAYLRFKLPKKKKKKKQGGKSIVKNFKNKKNSNTRSSNKTTKTVGVSFKTVNNLTTVAEKVYTVKKFQKIQTKKYLIYSGLIKDGKQSLGRFKVKVNK